MEDDEGRFTQGDFKEQPTTTVNEVDLEGIKVIIPDKRNLNSVTSSPTQYGAPQFSWYYEDKEEKWSECPWNVSQKLEQGYKEGLPTLEVYIEGKSHKVVFNERVYNTSNCTKILRKPTMTFNTPKRKNKNTQNNGVKIYAKRQISIDRDEHEYRSEDIDEVRKLMGTPSQNVSTFQQSQFQLSRLSSQYQMETPPFQDLSDFETWIMTYNAQQLQELVNLQNELLNLPSVMNCYVMKTLQKNILQILKKYADYKYINEQKQQMTLLQFPPLLQQLPSYQAQRSQSHQPQSQYSKLPMFSAQRSQSHQPQTKQQAQSVESPVFDQPQQLQPEIQSPPPPLSQSQRAIAQRVPSQHSTSQYPQQHAPLPQHQSSSQFSQLQSQSQFSPPSQTPQVFQKQSDIKMEIEESQQNQNVNVQYLSHPQELQLTLHQHVNQVPSWTHKIARIDNGDGVSKNMNETSRLYEHSDGLTKQLPSVNNQGNSPLPSYKNGDGVSKDTNEERLYANQDNSIAQYNFSKENGDGVSKDLKK